MTQWTPSTHRSYEYRTVYYIPVYTVTKTKTTTTNQFVSVCPSLRKPFDGYLAETMQEKQ